MSDPSASRMAALETGVRRLSRAVLDGPRAGPAFCAVLALGVGYLSGARLVDDAYITLRYARTIAETGEFAFNPGEHILGTTTPLFTLVLAAIHAISGMDLEWLAWVLAVGGHAATAALIAVMGRRCGFGYTGLLAGALYAGAPLAIVPAVGGMEASLFTAATLLALMPSPSAPTIIQALAAATAVLLRPEGILVALLHLLAARRAGPGALRRHALLIAVCVLPWLAFATWYFGSPVPHSVVAKWAAATNAASPWRASELFLYVLLGLPFSAPWPGLNASSTAPFGAQIAANLPFPASEDLRFALVLASTVGMLALLVLGVQSWLRLQRDAVWIVAFAVLYVASYCIARPAIFAWYLVPPLPVALLAWLTGGVCVIERVVSTPRLRYGIAAALSVMLLLGAARQVHRLGDWSRLTRRYKAAVEALGPAAQQPQTVIGALEVGAVGYATRARVVDYYGLVTAGLPGRDLSRMLDRFKPDYFVFHDGLATYEGLLADPQFRREYAKVATVDASGGFVHAEIQVWQRHD